MKKYLLLLCGTAFAVAAIFGVRRMAMPTPIEVKLTAVNTATVRKTVECSGKVQTASQREVYVQFPCIADEVYVREGQHVKKGDTLFSVDREATQQVLATLGGAADLTGMDSVVKAPITGVVQSLNVQAGDIAANTEPCAVISGGDGVSVTVAIREKNIASVAVGQQVELSGVAFAKDVYHGTITSIADTAHQELVGTLSTTVVDAVVMIAEDEVDTSLRAGLNARAVVITEVISPALPVPYNCIGQDDEGREYVYVYRNNGTAERIIPTFGATCAEGVLVVSGLAAGEQLVQNPDALSGDTVSVRVE